MRWRRKQEGLDLKTHRSHLSQFLCVKERDRGGAKAGRSLSSLQPKASPSHRTQHHARDVGVDFDWDSSQLIGLAEGVDVIELP